MIEFPRMAEKVPVGKVGDAEIRHFTVDTPPLRGFLHADEFVSPGTYACLRIKGEVMMSDTEMERRTNRFAVYHAHGHVLIAGLGLGMILHPILAKPEVLSVTVLELNPNVITLVEPTVRNSKLTVIEADAFKWKPAKGQKFNTVYFDIWEALSTETLDEMATLHRRYGHWLDQSDPKRYINSWRRDDLRRKKEAQNRGRGSWRL